MVNAACDQVEESLSFNRDRRRVPRGLDLGFSPGKALRRACPVDGLPVDGLPVEGLPVEGLPAADLVEGDLATSVSKIPCCTTSPL